MHKKLGCVFKGVHNGGDWGWASDDPEEMTYLPASESKILKIVNPMFFNFLKENLL